MVLLQLVVGHPVQVKPTKKRRDDAHDPEAAAKELNGPLPEGLEQSNGLAINATEYPSTVANALSPSNASQVRLAKSASTSSESEVRQATAAEIDEHTFYTKLSASSYCRGVIPGGKFDCKHCDQSLTLVKTFTTTLQDTNAMVLRGDGQKTIYIVFRGTNSIRSFVVDAVFIPVNYPLADGTKVHKGFLDSYNAVRDDLVKTIQEQADQYPDYKFVVTGHSLGGAQGVLCAVDLFNLNQTRYGVDNLEIFTQGEPRVGDIEFAHYLMNTQLPHERLVHKRDIVPHLPPGFMNFLHSGTEFWINNEGIQVCPNGIETDFCSNSIVPFTSLLDHFTYLDINVGLCL
ncbi:lipase [Phascolomyces articulosus]|uniref:Lipase n=1 Tax=Phascolomyces articulosus TaxID=60185 RepID=A0AAD5KM87_9FUNG|nr:lipase [Phascolomyces articulosus]